MLKCTKHPHRTEAAAIRCHSKSMARRVKVRTGDSSLKGLVHMRKNKPPRLTKHGQIWMLIWEEDANMEY